MRRIPLIRNVVIGSLLVAGSYLVAGFVNAPTISQPRLRSTYRSGQVIVVVPPPAVSEPAVANAPIDVAPPSPAALRSL